MELSWTTEDENRALYNTLIRPSGKRPALPAEVILQILDHPTRWICTHRADFSPSSAEESKVHLPLRVGASDAKIQMKVILSSQPLSADDIARLREVVFTFTSQDQGMSWDQTNHGTYEASFTWFEAGIRRPPITTTATASSSSNEDNDHNDDVTGSDQQAPEYPRFELQRNRHAGNHPEKYRKEFGLDHELVQALREGDVIELLACAQYPMWTNIIYCAGVEVWKVDKLKT